MNCEGCGKESASLTKVSDGKSKAWLCPACIKIVIRTPEPDKTRGTDYQQVEK